MKGSPFFFSVIATRQAHHNDALRRAMRLLWDEFNLLVEPAGDAALAVLPEEKADLRKGARVGVIVSGGNIDAGSAPAQFDRKQATSIACLRRAPLAHKKTFEQP